MHFIFEFFEKIGYSEEFDAIFYDVPDNGNFTAVQIQLQEPFKFREWIFSSMKYMYVHAEPKMTNKKKLEKAMGCKQIQKKINSENPLMSTVKLIHVNLKKKYSDRQFIY